MSNAARFYWAKLKRASDIFQGRRTEGQLDRVQDICCQLVNEFKCPRLCQIEALKLRSQCYPHNYWFAKAQLERALETIAKCEEHLEEDGEEDSEDDDSADDRAYSALRRAKRSIKAMLKDRTSKYQQEWKAKSRDIASSEDEWYRIVESESSNNETLFEFIGEPFKGSDWPFEAQAVEASVFDGKVCPPLIKVGPGQPVQQQQQQHKDEQDTDITMNDTAQATEEITGKV